MGVVMGGSRDVGVVMEGPSAFTPYHQVPEAAVPMKVFSDQLQQLIQAKQNELIM